LIDLILGLLTPTKGEVCVDGQNIEDELPGWQRQIGYIPQDIYLIDDSIRRNIAFGLPDDEIDAGAVESALRAAQLDAFVDMLPGGADTIVGDRGVRLSGGQRQRIGIARALYHNPKVLVMDEATSALDSETERSVVGAIGELRGDRTIIIIAHRLSTVEGCDQLYLLDKGKIHDHGSYTELMLRHKQLLHPSPIDVQTPDAVEAHKLAEGSRK
jgi:ATP-binding cassette subfamily C protein